MSQLQATAKPRRSSRRGGERRLRASGVCLAPLRRLQSVCRLRYIFWLGTVTLLIRANKNESLERINPISKTNGSLAPCNLCKRLVRCIGAWPRTPSRPGRAVCLDTLPDSEGSCGRDILTLHKFPQVSESLPDFAS